ncbi:hypothetical protein [Sphingomonas sp.]|jgi:hypothetical protein|uniref:hypothetical protein n=1 Tax=Sphingomonas sp. TaxID=28214 RepID=UPI002DE54313|nr:hypothetical protein [Sphingomonas sp.]
MIRIAVAVAALGMAAALAAQNAAEFEFSPVPRWSKEPENGELCKAVMAECPAFRSGDIEANMAFDELHDVRGYLIGIRMTRSTGCKPLDESVMLGRKEFRQRFESKDTPSLDDVTVELRDGIDPAGVRIVQRVDNMQIGMGCAAD